MSANRIVVEFDASDEARASAIIKEFRGEMDSLGSASASSATQLSAAAQKYEADLIKAGVAQKRAREEAEKYQAAQISAGSTAAKVYGEEAKAAELSAAQQKAAAESLQRQRSAALIAEMREADRQYQKDAERFLAAQNLKKKLAGHRLTNTVADEEEEADSAGGSGGSSRFGGGLRGQRALLRAGTRAVGLPGQISQIGGLGLYGGSFIGLGIGVAALAGLREIIKLDSEAEQAELNLAVAARGTGRSFGESKAAAEEFRATLHASREESVALAKSFGELQLRSGETIRLGNVEQFKTLAQAQGLKPEDAAKAIQSLSRGQLEGFQALTGETEAQGQLLLDNYARSIGTTADKLTEMERVQVLSNQAVSDSNHVVAEAAARAHTLAAAWEDLKQTLSDVAEGIFHVSDAAGNQIAYLLTLGQYGKGPQATYEEGISAEDARQAELNRQAIAHNLQEQKAREAQAAINRQQTLSRDLQTQLAEQERQSRALPGEYQLGLNPEQRRDQDIAKLRERRDQLQAQYDAFKKIEGQFSSEDSKKFSDQFRDSIQQTTDQIRSLLDATAKEAEAKAKQLAEAVKTARDAAQSLLADVAQKADRDNPFVSLFIRARVEVEETRKRFLVFGKDFADMMAGVKRDEIQGEIALARFTSGFTALKLLQEARRLQQPFIGLTGPEERHLAVEQARINDVNNRADLDKQIAQLDNPYRRYGAFETRRDFDKQLRELQGIDTSGTGPAGQKALADAIVKLTDRIDSRILATSPDPIIRAARDARRGALITERDASARDIQDAIARERAGNLIQTDARELLRQISASGLKDDQKVKEFLAVTGTLSDKELVPDLRRAREQALREGARVESARSAQGEERAKKLSALVDKLDRLIGERGIKVDSGPAAQINISSRDLNAQTSTLGPAFTPESLREALPGYRE